MGSNYTRNISIYINGKEVQNNIKAIKGEMQHLINSQALMTRGTDEYKRAAAGIKQLKGILADHNAQLQTTKSGWGKMIDSVKGLLPAFSFGAIAAGAVGAFKKITQSTDTLSDKWDEVMGSMNSALSYFWKTLATGDWTNFITNMGEAIRLGKEYAKTLDNVNDRTRGLTMEESDYTAKILELEETMRNKGRSKDERIAAGEERLRIEELLTKKRASIQTEDFNNEIENNIKLKQIGEDRVKQLLKETNDIHATLSDDLVNKDRFYADEYAAKKAQYEKLKQQAIQQNYKKVSFVGDTSNRATGETDEMKTLNAELAAYPQAIKDYGESIIKFGAITDVEKDKIVAAYGKMKEAENSGAANTKRVRTQLHSLKAGMDIDGQKIEDKTIKDLEDKSKEAKEKAFKDLETQNQKDLNLIKQHQLEVNDSQEVYNKIIEDHQKKSLEAKLALQVKYGDDTTGTLSALLDIQLKQQEEFDKKSEEDKKKLHKKELDDLENQGKNELAQIKKDALAQELSEEETNALLIAKEIEFLNKKLILQKEHGEETAETAADIAVKINELAENAVKGDEGRLKSLADLRKKYGDDEVNAKQERDDDLAALDAAQKAGLIASEEEYQKLKTAIIQEYENVRFQKIAKYLQLVNNILGGASDFFATMKDAELAKAGDNAEKKAAIEKKYANKQQAVAIGQAVIGGALAVVNILSGKITGNPLIDGIIKAIEIALVVATTAAQIAKIKSQKFSEGGYTEDGNQNEPAGIVHKGEYVIPKRMVRNPMVAPIVANLEAWRTNPVRVNPLMIAATNNMKRYNEGGYTDLNGKIGLADSYAESGATNRDQYRTDKLQNEILAELIGRTGSVISENTAALNNNVAATNKLMTWKPKVYTEDIKKGLDNLKKIEEGSRM